MFIMSKQSNWSPTPRPWVWKEILDLLKRQGISLAEFGRRIGAERSQIGNWKRAKSVPDKAASAIAKELGRSTDWVLNGRDAPTTPGLGQRLILRWHKYDPVRVDAIYDHILDLEPGIKDLPEDAQGRLIMAIYNSRADDIDHESLLELVKLFR